MLNPIYNEEKTLAKIREQFKADFPSIQLHEILAPEAYTQLRKTLLEPTYTREHIPDKHRYARAPLSKALLKNIITFIEKLLNITSTTTDLHAYQMEWKDYTLMHDEETKECVEFILDLTQDWDESWGGMTIYHEEDYHIIPPTHNTLVIIRRSKKTQRFIKYINNHVQKKRHFILGQLYTR